jgi:hypothetical protein
MRAKLSILAVGAAAALCGFWAGSYHADQKWEQIAERQLQSQNHVANRGRAAIAASVLRNLAESKQSEARDALEWQLDLGIYGMLFYVSNYSRTGVDSIDVLVIDRARSYRSQHPWTNSPRPDLTETLRRAFDKAD